MRDAWSARRLTFLEWIKSHLHVRWLFEFGVWNLKWRVASLRVWIFKGIIWFSKKIQPILPKLTCLRQAPRKATVSLLQPHGFSLISSNCRWGKNNVALKKSTAQTSVNRFNWQRRSKVTITTRLSENSGNRVPQNRLNCNPHSKFWITNYELLNFPTWIKGSKKRNSWC